MSISAAIPVANLTTANATLEAQGFGPGNFSVPVYTNTAPTHATLHCWDYPAFEAAVKALPNVTWSTAEGTPAERVQAAVAPVSGHWAGNAQPLTGQVTPGLYRDADDVLWWVIQPYNTAVYPDPAIIPALIRRARVPGVAAPWVQPLDQFDAYKLVNPFTGEPDRSTRNGKTRVVMQADGAGNNVWEPGVFGWAEIDEDGNVISPPSAQWVDTGATVTGQTGQLYYVSTPIANLNLTAGQAIRLGAAETTYVATWAGTDNLMQINPYVAAATGAKVWKWA